MKKFKYNNKKEILNKLDTIKFNRKFNYVLLVLAGLLIGPGIFINSIELISFGSGFLIASIVNGIEFGENEEYLEENLKYLESLENKKIEVEEVKEIKKVNLISKANPIKETLEENNVKVLRK